MTKTMLAPIALNLWLDGRVSPKARPRVSNGHAYLPSTYRKWKHDAVLELLCQLGSRDCLPIAVPVAVEIALTGSSHRGDLDNLAGAVLDALVEASVLTDDRLSCVPKLVVTHTPNGKCGATIAITEFTNKELKS